MVWLGRLARSKVLIFNVLTLLSVVLVGDDIKEFVSTDTIIKVQAGVNILLRFFTGNSLKDN